MVKGRFAPSPSGRMHLGNVYTALLSWLSAKSQGGTWLLRVEDLDPGRSRPEYARLIEDDLIWLGLPWDEGGLDGGVLSSGSKGSQGNGVQSGGQPGIYCQSRRGAIYETQLERLAGLCYPCWCSRADIMATQAPHEGDGRVVYAGTCRPARLGGNAADSKEPRHIQETAEPRHIPENSRRPATRIVVPDRYIEFTDKVYGPQRVNLARQCGDFVLRRGDGAWAYQLAVTVDDALMGVTEVVRGRDLLLSTAQQIYLYELLGFRAPVFAHLPLLCSASGERLCKRDKSLDMGELRKRHSPEEITGWLASMAGILEKPEPCTPASLIPLFDWEKIPKEDLLVEHILETAD